MTEFVGRAEPLARLVAAHRAAAGLALVTGEAGIGKSALLARFGAEVAAAGAVVVHGTCWDGDQAPAWWPWTQALRALLDRCPGLRAHADPRLAAVVPELGPGPAGTERLPVFEAVARLLIRAGDAGPVVVVLDDLQWADRSTVDLMRFLVRHAEVRRVLVVGAFRPLSRRGDPVGDARFGDPVGDARFGDPVGDGLADLAAAAELVALRGLPPGDVGELVRSIAGDAAAARWAESVYRRSGGHPFLARELCHLIAGGGPAGAVPGAIRDAIARRLAGLPDRCVAVLDAAAVAGSAVQPDVLADACGEPLAAVVDLLGVATAAGVLAPSGDRFAHDLYRETVYTGLSPARRLDLHHRIADALVRRHGRGSEVFPADLARHFAAAVAVAGPEPALRWSRAAAEADGARFAFADAAGHLARVRAAVTDAGRGLTTGDLVHLLAEEADLRLRSGDAETARALLGTAWKRADAADLLVTVALGFDRVGARFAMPRTELIGVLDAARTAVDGQGGAAEAQVTAALARQLQHSVPADRVRARPLAERAVAAARELDEVTLASCLLAQHDALWTPGTATEREAIATEIAALARRAGESERHAQAVLLTATARLENGSAGFRAALAEYQYLTERLRQPRHTYVLRTRQAALALLDGDLALGERLSAEAAALGEAVGDRDTGNVRMSQRLEIVRARADRAEMRDLAAEAVRWWVGAPAHAHAVAAGFAARAGDLDLARREVDTVLALDDWRGDRSYLWSIFVGELVVAAIALGDRDLCASLLDDLRPVADTCAVNGALVCFMGAHAHRVGLLHAALDRPDEAERWLTRALDTHRRLGARAWVEETRGALARVEETRGAPARVDTAPVEAHQGVPVEVPGTTASAALRRVGDMWEARYRDRTAYLRDAKGLHDLAALLARPGVDIAALALVAPSGADMGSATEPVLDRRALAGYRRRLADLDGDITTARGRGDDGRLRLATDERELVLAELRRATRPGGAPRALGASAAERARKAVTARIRDAIRRIGAAHPELGSHLDRTVRTGTVCRYDP
ncbi:ATP-binding protein [Virgisporangium ochraceum]|uniref:Orc1-like AAA ATPase domain-containing protein n=1 Tax=Virgisporangium ochraceum TaxID=65505 RepID=A0A8J3ZRT3_9ACTN|nr:AAA family ATPase [Virgisporangium ochraceum]GIJ67833.1 hypothetical protein Voc01_027500 [Virgisporangium ochraceum]